MEAGRLLGALSSLLLPAARRAGSLEFFDTLSGLYLSSRSPPELVNGYLRCYPERHAPRLPSLHGKAP
jgi:hypothetical protein